MVVSTHRRTFVVCPQKPDNHGADLIIGTEVCRGCMDFKGFGETYVDCLYRYRKWLRDQGLEV